ncbi:MAG TPA: porin [Leucothrix mucor]|nr:porin [Leucothrix mucor]
MKKLLAIAIAAGLAAPMAVMADTTLYGKMKVSVGSDKTAGVKTTTVNAHSSRLGVKGSTAMDNGMSVTYKLEMATKGIIDANGSLGARDSWVGLKGSFGEVRVGRHSTPYALSSDMFDMLNIGHQNISDGAAGFRVNNAIAYLKGYGPVGIAAAYVPDETAGVNNDATSLLGSYKSNGIKAALGYQKIKNVEKAFNLGLGYKFPAGHAVNYVYNQIEDTGTSVKTKNSALNGRYKFGKAYVQAEIGKTKGLSGANTVVELGYGLGKGTTVWTSIGKNDIGTKDNSHARVGITSNF